MKSSSERLLVFVLVALAAACREPPRAAPAHGDAGARDGGPEGDPQRCAGCHMPEFRTTHHPPHPDARPTTCGVCHTQASWHRWRVDHPTWELTGAHLRAAQDESVAGVEKHVKCFWCHRGDPPVFEGTKKECVACHEEDREEVRLPGHTEFGTACETCHSTDKWKPAKRPPRTTEHDAGAPHDAGASVDAGTHTVPTPKPTAAPKPTATAPKPTATTPPRPPAPDVTSRASRRH